MKIEKCGNITLINGDCMEFMQSQSDKSFDLAIVDPPYGLGKRTVDGRGKNTQIRFLSDLKRTNWDDEVPSKEYFEELKRVSKNEIIFGGNYFNLPPCRCFIVWDKEVYIPSMSQVEFAYTTFDIPARLVKIPSRDKHRFHPTQKPIKLYEWILINYGKTVQKILDTHGGSMSHAIAAHKLGFDLTIIEKDPVYYEKAKKRLIEFQRQQVLF